MPWKPCNSPSKLTSGGNTLAQYVLPSRAIEDCNTALAVFGDSGDLLRALRIHFKMLKAASLIQQYPSRSQHSVLTPNPTLVTFLTIMSQTIYLGKPLVAIGLWNIMRLEANFFLSNGKNVLTSLLVIVLDVKAANILRIATPNWATWMRPNICCRKKDRKGGGGDVPGMSLNLVTYNTLLDACHNAGELDMVLCVKELLLASGMPVDTCTYTTLIATVTRKASAASRANDPIMAFLFLQEMQALHIRPNGMTYSALVNVCGRCQ
jgi:pentatricopeptide repeat protein